MSADFLTCLKRLMTICEYIHFYLDIEKKILTINLTDQRKLIIKLFNVNTNTNIQANLITNNIEKITYINLGIYYEIDLRKAYILGKLIYTPTDFYHCITIT